MLSSTRLIKAPSATAAQLPLPTRLAVRAAYRACTREARRGKALFSYGSSSSPHDVSKHALASSTSHHRYVSDLNTTVSPRITARAILGDAIDIDTILLGTGAYCRSGDDSSVTRNSHKISKASSPPTEETALRDCLRAVFDRTAAHVNPYRVHVAEGVGAGAALNQSFALVRHMTSTAVGHLPAGKHLPSTPSPKGQHYDKDEGYAPQHNGQYADHMYNRLVVAVLEGTKGFDSTSPLDDASVVGESYPFRQVHRLSVLEDGISDQSISALRHLLVPSEPYHVQNLVEKRGHGYTADENLRARRRRPPPAATSVSWDVHLLEDLLWIEAVAAQAAASLSSSAVNHRTAGAFGVLFLDCNQNEAVHGTAVDPVSATITRPKTHPPSLLGLEVLDGSSNSSIGNSHEDSLKTDERVGFLRVSPGRMSHPLWGVTDRWESFNSNSVKHIVPLALDPRRTLHTAPWYRVILPSDVNEALDLPTAMPSDEATSCSDHAVHSTRAASQLMLLVNDKISASSGDSLSTQQKRLAITNALVKTLPTTTSTVTSGWLRITITTSYAGYTNGDDVRRAQSGPSDDANDTNEDDEASNGDDRHSDNDDSSEGSSGDALDSDDIRGVEHVFQYRVTIRNEMAVKRAGGSKKSPDGDDSIAKPYIAVISRHWFFADVAERSIKEVAGPSVVGMVPVLFPGQEISYDSGVTMSSRSGGYMRGTLQAVIRDARADHLPSGAQTHGQISPDEMKELNYQQHAIAFDAVANATALRRD